MIETTDDLIAELKKLPKGTPVRGLRWDNRFSGDSNDTDMSDYVTDKIRSIEMREIYNERTLQGKPIKAVIISASSY